MKRIKSILFALSILLACFLLSACGGKLETNLNLNSEFKGSRVMTLTVNKEENLSYVTGDEATITAAVEEGVPEELTFESSSDDQNVVYTFTLNFDSKEDYEKKLTSLLEKAGRTQEEMKDLVSYSNPDSVFAKGLSIKESFSSKDLLKWFDDLIIEKGYVEESNRSSIYESAQYHLVYEEEKFDIPYAVTIDFDNIEYMPINGVKFLTDVKPGQKYDRLIIVSVPEQTISKKGEDIEAYLKERAGKADFSKAETHAETAFILKAENMSAEELDSFTKEFLGQEDQAFGLKVNEGDEKSKANSMIFYSEDSIEENINLQNYVSGYNGKVDFEYYVNKRSVYIDSNKENKEKEAYFGFELDGKSAKDVKGGYSLSFDETIKDEVDAENYTKLFSQYGLQFSCAYKVYNPFDVENMDISVSLKGDKDFVRKVNVDYIADLSDKAFEDIKNKAEGTFKDSALSLKSVKKTEKGFSVSIEEDTKKSEEKNAWNSVFKNKENKVKYEVSPSKSDKSIVFTDEFSLGNITSGNIKTLNYEFGKIKSLPMKKDTNIEKGKYTKVYTDINVNDISQAKDDIYAGVLKVTVEGVRIPEFDFVKLILIPIVIILLVVGAFFGFKLMKKSKSGVQTEKSHAEPVQEINTQTSDVQEQESVFCGDCGTKNNKGEKFCGNCGAKLE